MINKTDDYNFEVVADKDSFCDALKELKDNRTWFEVEPKSIFEFNALDTCALFADYESVKYNTTAEMLLDTMSGAGMAVTIDGNAYLLRDTAVGDFINRAGFSCTVSRKISTERLAALLKEFIDAMNKNIRINYCYGKITAALSPQYQHVDEQWLLDKLESFSQLKFRAGFITCSRVWASYEVTEAKEQLLDEYSKQFVKVSHLCRMAEPDDITPIIEFSTGSSGDNSIIVSTFLEHKGVRVKLGQPINIIHKGEVKEKFESEIRFLYPRFVKDIEVFNKLSEVFLVHPYEVADHVLTEIGLNKRKYSKYYNKTLNFVSSVKIVTAQDLYWALSKFTDEMKIDNCSKAEINDVVDCLFKLLRLDFKKYDYQKKVKATA